MPSSTSDVDAQPFGRRLLPVFIDQLAEKEPDRLFCIIPGFSDGPRRVTIADFARAVNRAAFWLDAQLGRGRNFETLAYIGPNDVRYFALVLAAVKAGYKLLLPSPRNSVQNHMHVFEATKCNTLLRASTANVDHILGSRDLHSVTVPDLKDFLDTESVPVYSYKKTFEEAKSDPFLVLHSSGSMGPPKPIFWTNSSVASFDNHHNLPHEPDSRPIFSSVPEGTTMLAGLPFFHMAGLTTGLIFNTWFNVPSVHLPPSSVPSAGTILSVLDIAEPESALLAPSILEEMSSSPEALAKLGKLSFLWYGGGPISDHAGNIICKQTELISLIGSTECGIYPLYLHDSHDSREDFAWFRFRPDVRGVEFQERADDLYELVMTRDGDIDYQTTFYNMPELQTYPTKDLYQKHPSKAGYWKHVARSDDVIVLSNGEKVVGIPTENTLRQAHEVSEVILLGHGRFQVAALIELNEEVRGLPFEEIVNKIRPYAKHANEMMPGFARLSKDRVLFTTPEKPMLRTPKGTVVRKATLAAYEAEIDNLYRATSKDDTPAGPLLKCKDGSETEKTLLTIFGRVTDLQDLSSDQDIFVAGLDSLQVLAIVRQIKAVIQSEAPEHARDVNASLVYSNPTIRQLVIALRALSDPQSGSSENLHARKMEETLTKYGKDLPKPAYSIDFNHITVILTGSTGSLGSYLLDVLMSHPKISRIYAFNRAADGKSKQSHSSSSRKLSGDYEQKVVFLQTALGDHHFGLDDDTYRQISRETAVIIHNQWQVDFNLSLESFEPHIRGVRHFIDFSAESLHHPPIFFTSSISTTGNWPRIHPDKPIPEQVLGDVRVPLPIGYGESKYISENLLAAAGNTGVSAAICRVGQLGGPIEKGGMWGKQEWLPSLIASSKYLRLLPATLGTSDVSDWIPVDFMARIIVELAAHCMHIQTEKDAAWTRCFNLVNPRPTTWASLVPAVQAHLPADTKVVPYNEWLEALKQSAEAQDPVGNPGIKLLDFYEGIALGGGFAAAYSTSEAVKASQTMEGMEGVGEKWMDTWMGQWAF